MINVYFQLLDVLKEVHHLRSNEEYKDLLPPEGLAIFEKQETYRQYRINLGITIDWYNQIRKNSQKVEFDLVEDEIKAIDQRIEMAQNKLNWNSDGNLFFIDTNFDKIFVKSKHLQLCIKAQMIFFGVVNFY